MAAIAACPIAGALPLDRGTVRLAGHDATRWSEWRRAALVGRVFQNPVSGSIPHLTVAQASLDDMAAQVEPLLPLQSRAETVVLFRESPQAGHWTEAATFDLG